MNKTELKQVAKALTLPDGWEVFEVLPKGSGNLGSLPTEYIRVKFDAKLYDGWEDLKDKACKVVKQLDKLTVKTAAGTWKFTDVGEIKTDPGFYHIYFFVNFTYIRRHIGRICDMRAIQIGKTIRDDKFLTKTQVKREMNRLFDAGKPEAIVDLVRKFTSTGEVSEVDLEEIRFVAEAEE